MKLEYLIFLMKPFVQINCSFAINSSKHHLSRHSKHSFTRNLFHLVRRLFRRKITCKDILTQYLSLFVCWGNVSMTIFHEILNPTADSLCLLAFSLTDSLSLCGVKMINF